MLATVLTLGQLALPKSLGHAGFSGLASAISAHRAPPLAAPSARPEIASIPTPATPPVMPAAPRLPEAPKIASLPPVAPPVPVPAPATVLDTPASPFAMPPPVLEVEAAPAKPATEAPVRLALSEPAPPVPTHLPSITGTPTTPSPTTAPLTAPLPPIALPAPVEPKVAAPPTTVCLSAPSDALTHASLWHGRPEPRPRFEGSKSPEAFGRGLAAAAAEQTKDFVIYSARYQQLAYPMGDVAPLYGACSDVIIRAYRSLGIDLQDLVQRTKVGSGDRSIDHRRTETLRVLFTRFGESLPVTSFPEDYKPGDIVTYFRPFSRVSRSHIAIVSDRLAPSGRPLIIHNRGYGPQFEDALFVDRITGHYRFDGRNLIQPDPPDAAVADGRAPGSSPRGPAVLVATSLPARLASFATATPDGPHPAPASRARIR